MYIKPIQIMNMTMNWYNFLLREFCLYHAQKMLKAESLAATSARSLSRDPTPSDEGNAGNPPNEPTGELRSSAYLYL